MPLKILKDFSIRLQKYIWNDQILYRNILPVWWDYIAFKDITKTSDWFCELHIIMALPKTVGILAVKVL